MKNLPLNGLVKAAIVAALYVVVTLAIAPIAYGPLQFRVSEILILLCFLNPRYIFALTIGTLIANAIGSTIGIIDVFAGTFATMVSAILIYYTSVYLGEKLHSLIISTIWPIVINGTVVGWMLNYVFDLPLIPSMISVAVGEAGVMVVGVILFKMLSTHKTITDLIKG